MSNPYYSSSLATRRQANQQETSSPVLEALAPTGENPRVEALQTEIRNILTPFLEAPPEHQGLLGEVTQTLNGILGLINAPAALLDTGFAMLTADIAAAWPSFPAASIGLALHLGWPHAHAHPPSLIPPAPPIPLPSIGSVFLAGAINVHINGIPAARAGDVGLAVTCCSLAPPLEIVLGSSNVFIGGARAARTLDMTFHDNPFPLGNFGKGLSKLAKVATTVGKVTSKVGTALTVAGFAAGALNAATQALDAKQSAADADAAAEKAAQAEDPAQAAMAAAEAEAAAATASGQALGAALSAAQVAADAAALALQALVGKDPGIGPGVGAIVFGSPNVLVGGFPCPNLMEALKGLMKAALGLNPPPRRNDGQDAEGSGGVGTSCRIG